MWISDFLAPRSCVFCGAARQGDEQSVCAGCFVDLPWNGAAVSPVPGIFERSIAMLHYEFPADAAIKALKFNRRLYYASGLAEVLCSARNLLPDDIDAVLPVPLHWRRRTMRGFNQAEELAKPVRKLLDVPFVRGVVRCKATPFQSGLNATERSANIRNAFTMRSGQSFQHVLIIDDVSTTGATLHQLGKLLLVKGSNKVSSLVVAKAS